MRASTTYNGQCGTALFPAYERLCASSRIFYDDTTAWKAFWEILDPTDPVEYEDACDSARPGFCTVERVDLSL